MGGAGVTPITAGTVAGAEIELINLFSHSLMVMPAYKSGRA